MLDLAVICPTYNSASYIQQTLDSLLSQTCLPKMIIFSDDGSTDHTALILEQYQHFFEQKNITYVLLRNTHKGPGAARNAAIFYADTEWVAFIDSDDVWHPDKLRLIQKTILLNEKVNFICHSQLVKLPMGKKYPFYCGHYFNAAKPLFRQLYVRNFLCTSAITCKRALLLSCNGFDEQLQSSQDYDLWLKVSKLSEIYFLDEILGEYCVRENNISNTKVLNRFLNQAKVLYRYTGEVKYSDVFFAYFYLFATFLKKLLKKLPLSTIMRARS